MAAVASHLTVDLSALPSRSDELGVRFESGIANNKEPTLVVFPGTDASFEPQHLRYAVYMYLKLSDGTSAGNLGQLIVTGQRIIGMMTHGSAGGTRLDESKGSVFVFAQSLDDIQPAETKTRWTGRIAGVIIRSRQDQDPAFELEINSVVGTLADSGRLRYGFSFADLMNSLTPEARLRLRQPPASPT